MYRRKIRFVTHNSYRHRTSNMRHVLVVRPQIFRGGICGALPQVMVLPVLSIAASLSSAYGSEGVSTSGFTMVLGFHIEVVTKGKCHRSLACILHGFLTTMMQVQFIATIDLLPQISEAILRSIIGLRLQSECYGGYPIQSIQNLYFTRLCSSSCNVQRDKVFFSGVGSPEARVLG